MMRIRIDGGALTSEQLRVVADISTEYGRDVADITDRQNVQLHWIRIEDVPTIWEQLEAVGLSTTEACGDTPRVMLGCPLEGVAADSVLDARPALRETVERYLGDPAFSNLPRKFKTSISGCAQHCTNHEINDVVVRRRRSARRRRRASTCGSAAGCRPTRVRRAARRVRPAGRGQRRVGRRHARSSATTATAARATTRG